MIAVLGAKRVITLAILAGINVALILGVYVFMIPDLDKKERALRAVRGKVSTIQGDISNLQIEFEQFETQKERFEQYKQDGFFVQQDRRQVEDLFKLIQEKSGVVTAKVAVNPAIVEENQEAEKADHKILRSSIQIQLDALNDRDIYHYIHLINSAFPGHVTIETLDFERTSVVNGTILRAIAGGKKFPLVKASMEMSWRTMVPNDHIIAEGGR
ncbi:MAG: hypothetical protein KTR28_08975 [Micavibrio sp.]|nr:hypothetical protein [Micavibrio sp.]